MADQWMIQAKIDQLKHDLDLWFETVNQKYKCFLNPNPRRHILNGKWLFVITFEPYHETLTLQGKNELEALEAGYDWARANIPAAQTTTTREQTAEIDELLQWISDFRKGNRVVVGHNIETPFVNHRWVVDLNPDGYVKQRVYGSTELQALRETKAYLLTTQHGVKKEEVTETNLQVGDAVKIYGRAFQVESFLDDVPDGPRVLLKYVDG